MPDKDIASQLAFATDAIRGESRWLKEQAARVAETMDAAHPVMSAAWKRIRELEAALKPFADVADEFDEREDDHHEVWADVGPSPLIRERFRLRLFRVARAALPLQPKT